MGSRGNGDFKRITIFRVEIYLEHSARLIGRKLVVDQLEQPRGVLHEPIFEEAQVLVLELDFSQILVEDFDLCESDEFTRSPVRKQLYEYFVVLRRFQEGVVFFILLFLGLLEFVPVAVHRAIFHRLLDLSLLLLALLVFELLHLSQGDSLPLQVEIAHVVADRVPIQLLVRVPNVDVDLPDGKLIFEFSHERVLFGLLRNPVVAQGFFVTLVLFLFGSKK